MKEEKKDFVRYGKWDTFEHAQNGLTGKSRDKLAGARHEAFKIHQRQKEMVRNGEI